MGIRESRLALCVAFLLVLLSSPPLLVAQKLADKQANGDACCVVDSACLTSLALAAQQNSGILSSFKNVSTAVLSCVGVQSAVVRPLRMLLPDYSQAFMVQLLPTLKAAVGWDIDIIYAPASKVGALVLDTEATGRAFYDAWITETSWTLELASQGMIEPLDNYVSSDPQIEWLDVSRFPRTSSAVFNGTVVGVPVGGSMYLMHWRKDVFARAGLSPPQTWREAIAIARALNGSDFNRDGQPDYTLCLDMFNATAKDPAALLSQILASQTQTQGTGHGWLFSPETMEPFVDSPAMTEALDILSQLLPYTQRFTHYENLPAHPLVRGTCALAFTTTETFKATQLMGGLKGQFGSAPLPGSDVVLDRKTGTLVECSTELCPFATWSNISSIITAVAGGQQQQPAAAAARKLVNRASYSAYSGVLGMVNANSLSVYKAAVYRGLALFSSYQIALQVLLAPSTIGPYRQRLLSQSNDSLATWASRGYNTTDVAGYLSATQATLDHPNNALDLRVLHGPEFRSALAQAATYLSEGKDVATVQSLTSKRFAAITAGASLQQLGDGYLAGLNVKRRFVLPLTPPTPPPPPATPPSGSSGLGTGEQVGIIIGSVLGGLLVVALVVVMVVARGRTHRRWGFFGTHLPPGVGAGTTLVVTDIENSTLLWESIEQDVMNVALELHHTLVRKLLIKHRGYESATEGDSFIAAFHTPLDALRFSQAFQAGLLSLEWPAEVLACKLSCPVWVKPCVSMMKKSESTRSLGGRPSGALAFHYSLFRATSNSLSGAGNDSIAAVRTTLDGKPTGNGLYDRPSLSGSGSGANPTSDVTFNRQSNNQPFPQQKASPSPVPHKQRSRLMLTMRTEPWAGPASNDSTPGTPRISINGAPLSPQLPAPQTALSVLMQEWKECDPPLPREDPKAEGKRLASRGLRVRVGLHSGLDDPRDAVLNATTGRLQYSGSLLYTAKAVGDCGHGGMVLLSHACFSVLPSASLQSTGSVLNMGEFSFTKGGSSEVVKPCALYQVVASDMQHRLAVLEYKLRSVTQLQVGVLQAPVNQACIAFANVVGAAALMAWDAEVAGAALDLYQRKAVELLLSNGPSPVVNGAGSLLGDGGTIHEPQPPGYVVELASGLCLAAFQTPASALLWALRLVESLLAADWDPELLAHELCEELCIGGGGSSMAIRRTPKARPASIGDVMVSAEAGSEIYCTGGRERSTRMTRLANLGGLVLFRGLRLKIGVDMGSVHAKINPCTGRMAYRGRVMNRTARIADKAGSGQVWCSKAVVEEFEATAGQCLNTVEAHPLGSFNLKGVTEPVDLMQCVLLEGSAADMM